MGVTCWRLTDRGISYYEIGWVAYFHNEGLAETGEEEKIQSHSTYERRANTVL